MFHEHEIVMLEYLSWKSTKTFCVHIALKQDAKVTLGARREEKSNKKIFVRWKFILKKICGSKEDFFSSQTFEHTSKQRQKWTSEKVNVNYRRNLSVVQAGVAVVCVSVAGGHSCKVKRVNAEGEKKNEKSKWSKINIFWGWKIWLNFSTFM